MLVPRETLSLVTGLVLALFLSSIGFAQEPKMASIYHCDTEAHARRFADLMQEHDRGKALALVNEENYWRSGSLATCGLANCMFVELEVIDEVRTVYGYMKLVKVSVIGQEDEDNGTLSLAPTIRFVFRKLEGV